MYQFGHCSGDLQDVYIADMEDDSFPSTTDLSCTETMDTDPKRLSSSLSMDLREHGPSMKKMADEDLKGNTSSLARTVNPKEHNPPITKTPDIDHRGHCEILSGSTWKSEDSPREQQHYSDFWPVGINVEKQSDGKDIWGPLGTRNSGLTYVPWPTSGTSVGRKNSEPSDGGYSTYVGHNGDNSEHSRAALLLPTENIGITVSNEALCKKSGLVLEPPDTTTRLGHVRRDFAGHCIGQESAEPPVVGEPDVNIMNVSQSGHPPVAMQDQSLFDLETAVRTKQPSVRPVNVRLTESAALQGRSQELHAELQGSSLNSPAQLLDTSLKFPNHLQDRSLVPHAQVQDTSMVLSGEPMSGTLNSPQQLQRSLESPAQELRSSESPTLLQRSQNDPAPLQGKFVKSHAQLQGRPKDSQVRTRDTANLEQNSNSVDMEVSGNIDLESSFSSLDSGQFWLQMQKWKISENSDDPPLEEKESAQDEGPDTQFVSQRSTMSSIYLPSMAALKNEMPDLTLRSLGLPELTLSRQASLQSVLHENHLSKQASKCSSVCSMPKSWGRSPESTSSSSSRARDYHIGSGETDHRPPGVHITRSEGTFDSDTPRVLPSISEGILDIPPSEVDYTKNVETHNSHQQKAYHTRSDTTLEWFQPPGWRPASGISEGMTTRKGQTLLLQPGDIHTEYGTSNTVGHTREWSVPQAGDFHAGFDARVNPSKMQSFLQAENNLTVSNASDWLKKTSPSYLSTSTGQLPQERIDKLTQPAVRQDEQRMDVGIQTPCFDQLLHTGHPVSASSSSVPKERPQTSVSSFTVPDVSVTLSSSFAMPKLRSSATASFTMPQTQPTSPSLGASNVRTRPERPEASIPDVRHDTPHVPDVRPKQTMNMLPSLSQATCLPSIRHEHGQTPTTAYKEVHFGLPSSACSVSPVLSRTSPQQTSPHDSSRIFTSSVSAAQNGRSSPQDQSLILTNESDQSLRFGSNRASPCDQSPRWTKSCDQSCDSTGACGSDEAGPHEQWKNGTSDRGRGHDRGRPDYRLQQSSESTVSCDRSFHAPMDDNLMPPLPVQDQTWTEMDVNKELFVPTLYMEEALDLLKSHSLVLFTGPPGCGKTTLALALLRHADDEGKNCLIVKTFQEWREWVGDQQSSKTQVILLDHMFGQRMLKASEVDLWRQSFDGMVSLLKKGSVQLVFIFYPHILLALRQMVGSCSLFSSLYEVQMDRLNDREKAYLLYHNLERTVTSSTLQVMMKEAGKCQLFGSQCEANRLVLEERNGDSDRQKLFLLLQRCVLNIDDSGAMFPNCCQWFATTLKSYVSLPDSAQKKGHLEGYLESATKIFSRPSPLYKEFVGQLLLEQDVDREKIQAAFSLLLAGVDVTDMNNSARITRICQDLGFSCVHSPVGLKEMLDAFKITLIKEDCCDFINRHAYEGTALALAVHIPHIVVKVVDWPFLVKRCKVPTSRKNNCVNTYTDKNLKPFQLEIKRVTLDRSRLLPAYRALVERIAKGLQTPEDMLYAVQHPALQAQEFVGDLKSLYMKQGEKTVKAVLSETYDSSHQMPLLYWAVFNSQQYLFEWIFKTVMKLHGQFRKKDLVLAACACCVLSNKADFLKLLLKHWRRATHEDVQQLLKGHFIISSSSPLRLPLPKVDACLVPSWKDQLQYIKSILRPLPQESETEAPLFPSLSDCETDSYPANIASSDHGASELSVDADSTPPSAGDWNGARTVKSTTKGIDLSQPPLFLAKKFSNQAVMDLLNTYHRRSS